MEIKFCPKCKSEKIIMPRGDRVIWRCIDCGFEAAIFPEKEKINKKQKPK